MVRLFFTLSKLGPLFLPVLCVRGDNPGLHAESPMMYVGAGRPAGGNGRCGGDCLCYVGAGRGFAWNDCTNYTHFVNDPEPFRYAVWTP